MKHTYATKTGSRGMHGVTSRFIGRCVGALALALVMLLLASCSKPTPVVTVGSAEAKAGDIVELTVSIENNPGIMAFILGFEYDTTRLEMLDAVTLPAFGEDSEYIRRLVWVGDYDTTYNGEFIKLTFKVLADAAPGDATVRIVCEEGDMCNYHEKDIIPTLVDGKVTVTA